MRTLNSLFAERSTYINGGCRFIKAEAGVFALVDFAPLVEKIEGDLPVLEKVDKMIVKIKQQGVLLVFPFPGPRNCLDLGLNFLTAFVFRIARSDSNKVTSCVHFPSSYHESSSLRRSSAWANRIPGCVSKNRESFRIAARQSGLDIQKTSKFLLLKLSIWTYNLCIRTYFGWSSRPSKVSSVQVLAVPLMRFSMVKKRRGALEGKKSPLTLDHKLVSKGKSKEETQHTIAVLLRVYAS